MDIRNINPDLIIRASEALRNNKDNKISGFELNVMQQIAQIDGDFSQEEITFLNNLDNSDVINELLEGSSNESFPLDLLDEKDNTLTLDNGNVVNASNFIRYSPHRNNIVNGSDSFNLSQMNKSQRLEIMNQLSQYDSMSKTKWDSDRCGAACIVAGAMYAGGNDDLIKIIEHMEKLIDKYDSMASESEELLGGIQIPENTLNLIFDIKMKLQDGESITFDDMSLLQDALYMTIKNEEILNRGKEKGTESDGLRSTFIESFIQDSGLNISFDENHIHIHNIDIDTKIDGKKTNPEHLIMTIGEIPPNRDYPGLLDLENLDKVTAVYDPEVRDSDPELRQRQNHIFQLGESNFSQYKDIIGSIPTDTAY